MGDMKQEDVDKLLKGREAVDKHRNRDQKDEKEEKHTESTLKLYDELYKIGFGNAADSSSLFAFDKFNRDMNYTAYKESYPIDGECDGCPHLAVAPCVEKYGASRACFGVKPKAATEDVYRVAYAGRINRQSVTDKDKTILVCPDGHGFYVDSKKSTEPPFDITWKI